MAITITLPDELEKQLQRAAVVQHRSVQEVTLGILQDALEPTMIFPTAVAVVAQIKATNPNPQNIRPAQGSLADALRSGASDAQFDLAEWDAKWATVEAELRAMTRADDMAEGRG